MAKTDISFENEDLRYKHKEYIRELFKNNNINWLVSPSAKTKEILIHPTSPPPENERVISRISLQINKEGELSFGVSGYNPLQMIKIKENFETNGYKYDDTRPKKRIWIKKSLDNLESIVNEFKKIESLLF